MFSFHSGKVLEDEFSRPIDVIVRLEFAVGVEMSAELSGPFSNSSMGTSGTLI